VFRFKSILTLAAGALVATTISASAALVITPHLSGPNTGGATGVGAPSAGFGAFTPAGATWDKDPTVDPGISTTNVTLSPFGGGDPVTPYFLVTTGSAGTPPGQNSPVTLTFNSARSSLDNFLWGSIDNANSMQFKLGDSVIATVLGSDLLGNYGLGTSVGNQYLLLSFMFDDNETFNKIEFNTGTIAFEFATPIPLPAAAWLLLGGIAGLGLVSRRRKSA
jgi:hypothetical protein